jgi:hypothetical protein
MMENKIEWETETKKIEKLKWKNYEFDVVIKKINAGDEADISDGSLEIKMLGRLEKREFNAGKAKLLSILKGIHDAPFPHKTIEDIRKIPKEVSQAIYDEISKFNGFDENEKKSDSTEPSESQPLSQG